MLFEDILSKRKREGYRRLEQKLSTERLALFEQIITKELTQREILRRLDKVFEYFDRFIRERFIELGVFPTIYAKEMIDHYQKKKKEILEMPSHSSAKNSK